MKKTIMIIIAIILIIVGVLLVATYKKENTDVKEGKRVVTSFYPMYIITANITKNVPNVSVENMADVNVGCLHNYSLTTNDMKKIEKADIFVQNGLGMENFIEKILETKKEIKIVNSSKNIENKIQGDEINPHIWTSLENYVKQITNIKEGLKEADPENANLYEENANSYIAKINEKNQEYNEQKAKLNGKKAICLNEAISYLLKEMRNTANSCTYRPRGKYFICRKFKRYNQKNGRRKHKNNICSKR